VLSWKPPRGEARLLFYQGCRRRVAVKDPTDDLRFFLVHDKVAVGGFGVSVADFICDFVITGFKAFSNSVFKYSLSILFIFWQQKSHDAVNIMAKN